MLFRSTLLTGFGSEEMFVDLLLSQFAGRLPDAREFALLQRVLLARTRTGIDLDFALGAFPYEEVTVQRATSWKLNESISLVTCSAEDLIVHKVFAGRDRDWADVETVLARQHGSLNLRHIRAELPPLLDLKGAQDSFQKLEYMIDTVHRRVGS